MKLPEITVILVTLCLSTTTTVHGAVCGNGDHAKCEGRSTNICHIAGAASECKKLCGICAVDGDDDCQDQSICIGMTDEACEIHLDVRTACPVLCGHTIPLAPGVTAPATKCVKTVCVDPYEKVGNLCLIYGTKELTWTNAKAECARLKGQLVVQKDLKKISTHLLDNRMNDWQYWVGASDQGNAGDYKWLNTDKDEVAGDLFKWDSYKPGNDNSVTRGQSCVTLWVTADTNSLLTNAQTNCLGLTTHRYICEPKS